MSKLIDRDYASVQLPSIASLPPVVYDKVAQTMLSSEVKEAMGTYLEVLRSLPRNAKKGVRVSEILVSGYLDPEEGFKQLVVNLKTDSPAELVLDFWDAFGSFLDLRIAELDNETGKLVSDLISTNVLWKS